MQATTPVVCPDVYVLVELQPTTNDERIIKESLDSSELKGERDALYAAARARANSLNPPLRYAVFSCEAMNIPYLVRLEAGAGKSSVTVSRKFETDDDWREGLKDIRAEYYDTGYAAI